MSFSNNTRVLTPEEYETYKTKYSFIVFEDNIAVKVKDYNRVTLHSFKETFSINAKPCRKMSFTPEAMSIWKQMLKSNPQTNLIDVQQAVNKLHITYQKITLENVKDILEGKDIKIKVEEII